MNQSSTSLFHFTSNLDNLKSILTHNFISLYSPENFINIVSGKNEPHFCKGVAMVCFCDIPLSRVTKHSDTYGKYAIGLRKEWAVKNKINPVIYTYQNSEISNSLYEMYQCSFKKPNKEIEEKFDTIVQYIKPYSGDFKRGDQIIENYRFYDEREWRYIPKLDETMNMWIRGTEDYSLESSISEMNETFLKTKFSKAMLSFDASDIKYIIVKDENDIHEIMAFFKSLKKSPYSLSEIELLMTKISLLDDIVLDY